MRHTAKNRRHWNEQSREYQSRHGVRLWEEPLAWGVWRVPESTVSVLGAVDDQDVLELGCGAAQWTESLARQGARATGIDLSEEQLATARQRMRVARLPSRLVHGDAERLPFSDESFDIVFCDHGATTFARPEETVAEAARVLRPAGVLAFCMSTPLRDICLRLAGDEVGQQLVANYFGLSVLEDADSVCYQLPYGSWIRLFRRHGLIVEDLVELQAPRNARTTYSDYVPHEWARQWPAEHIWKLRKAPHQDEARS